MPRPAPVYKKERCITAAMTPLGSDRSQNKTFIKVRQGSLDPGCRDKGLALKVFFVGLCL